MIIRYTLPEQVSSRTTLQLSSSSSSDQALTFSHWVELHPSKLLPLYAIQSIIEMGGELKSAPNKLISKIHCSDPDPQSALSSLAKIGITAPSDLVFSSPLIVQEAIAGESMTTLLTLAQSRGWTELPVPFALGVFISMARGLEYLHALGFSHGALSSDSISLRYVSQSADSPLTKINQSGGVVLTQWVTGQIFQLTPLADTYGRGASADCRALLWTFLEMLGGDSTVDVEGQIRQPLSHALVNESDLSPKAQAALSQLTPRFAQWIVQNLLTPPAHMGQMLVQLQRILDPNQAVFDPKGISRWLTRLVPERAQQWEQILGSGDAQTLPHLVQSGGILTTHKDQSLISESSASQPQASSTQPDQIRSSEQSISKISPALPSSEDQSKSNTSKAKVKKANTPINGSFLERLDYQLDHIEGQIQDRFTPKKGLKTRLRVAVIWLDTVRSIQEFDLHKPITVGSDPKAMVRLPIDINGENFSLFTPSSGEVLVHAHQSFQGWVSAHDQATKQSWSTHQTPSMAKISLGGKGLIQLGEFGIFFQLQMLEPPPPLWVPKLPIPKRNASLFWCLAFAAGLHLALLIMAYSSKSYTFRERGVITTSKFVEVLTQKIEEQKEEQEEEQEEDEMETLEDLTEVAEESYEPEPVREIPRVREEARDLAQKRFGKGKAAVDALADFLSGKSDSSEGKLALGDVSAALGTSADSGLSLGSAFGEAGGQLNLGGSGGGLNTSGGLKGSRTMGKLKTKRVKRRVPKIKTLRSRTRVSGGKLSKEAVMAVIRKNMRKLNACYERQLIKSPNLSGKLTVAWIITPAGKVTGVKQVLSTMKSAALKSCVLKIFKKMRFPKPKGGKVKVKYPLVFQQG